MIVWQREKKEAAIILCSVHVHDQPVMDKPAGNRAHQQVKNKINPISFEWQPAISNSDYLPSDLPFSFAKSGENTLNRSLAAELSLEFLACFQIPEEKDPYFLTRINVY
ncbi:MAG TPA: hypothetical protein PKZ60_09135 [Candidatus Saccharicenans sp.]|nr:hypothetical protein [Candidatus Saccharicenans sp.]